MYCVSKARLGAPTTPRPPKATPAWAPQRPQNPKKTPTTYSVFHKKPPTPKFAPPTARARSKSIPIAYVSLAFSPFLVPHASHRALQNRNDPLAAQKFHALTVASALLLDPLRRLALDAQLRLAAAKKARFAAFDNKKRALVTELEARERAFKKSRLEQEKQKVAREGENDRIKEEGRRMREERERRLEELARAKAEQVHTEADEEGSDENAPPPLGPYDTTVRVKFTLSAFPSLNTASTLAAHLRRFGEIDEDAVVLSIKPKKAGKKKSQEKGADGEAQGEKVVNAVVPFSQISAAFGVVSSGPTLKERGMEVSWAGGSEPPILEWLRNRGELGGNLKGSISSAAPVGDVSGGNPQKGALADETKFSTFVSLF